MPKQESAPRVTCTMQDLIDCWNDDATGDRVEENIRAQIAAAAPKDMVLANLLGENLGTIRKVRAHVRGRVESSNKDRELSGRSKL